MERCALKVISTFMEKVDLHSQASLVFVIMIYLKMQMHHSSFVRTDSGIFKWSDG